MGAVRSAEVRIPRVFSFPRGGVASWLDFCRTARAWNEAAGTDAGEFDAGFDACRAFAPLQRNNLHALARLRARASPSRPTPRQMVEAREAFPRFALTQQTRIPREPSARTDARPALLKPDREFQLARPVNFGIEPRTAGRPLRFHRVSLEMIGDGFL